MAFFKELQSSITYPFEDTDWLSKSWLLLLLPLIPIVSVLAPILYKGWRYQMIENLSKGEQKLPELNPIAWLQQGAILWVIWFAYLLLPGFLLSIFGFSGPIDMLGDIYDLITTSNFQAWLSEQASDWMVSFVVYLVWGIFAYPLYQAGVIRYVISGNWKSTINLPRNALVLMQHILPFISYFIMWLVLIFCVALADILLSITVVGILIIPLVTLTLYYVTTAYKLGNISRAIVLKNTHINKV